MNFSYYTSDEPIEHSRSGKKHSSKHDSTVDTTDRLHQYSRYKSSQRFAQSTQSQRFAQSTRLKSSPQPHEQSLTHTDSQSFAQLVDKLQHFDRLLLDEEPDSRQQDKTTIATSKEQPDVDLLKWETTSKSVTKRRLSKIERELAAYMNNVETASDEKCDESTTSSTTSQAKQNQIKLASQDILSQLEKLGVKRTTTREQFEHDESSPYDGRSDIRENKLRGYFKDIGDFLDSVETKE